MAFCEQCGNKINDTAKFCGKCGTPVSSGQTEAQTEAQAEIPQTGVSANEESPAQKAFNAGMACLEADQYNEAIAHFTEAIRHKPDSAGAYYQRGYAHSLLEQYDAAIADLTAALPNTNDKAAFYFARGYNYYKSRQYGSAIADLDQAIRLNPNEAKYYGTRGTAYLENGDADSAYADCERGLQIDPNEDTLINLAHAIDEADEQGGMSAPAATPSACAQCGAPLEDGEMFCANCGAKVGAAAQYQSAPVQTQRQAEKKWVCKICGYVHTGSTPPVACPQCKAPASKFNEKPAPAQIQRQTVGDGVLKKGKLSTKPGFWTNGKQGDTLLYRDRLEWHGDETSFVIFIKNISSVKLSSDNVYIKITLNNNEKYEFFSFDFTPDDEGLIEITPLKDNSWYDAINSVRNGTLG